MWDALIITPFVNALLFIYNLVGQNFGLAIILFTLLIRLITHPLMVKQIKGAKAMQELQKNEKWLKIQEKYKNDREKLAQEQMALYRELGINPFASCLPTLIQFPIIIGLYQSLIIALASTPIELLNLIRHIYPALLKVEALIPLNSQFLWMDLGLPERLALPFLPVGIPILAIVVTVTTYLQGKLMTPPSANPKDQSAMFSNMMNLYMPFLMGYLALTLASGLALYFVVSNLIGILQYAMLGQLNWQNILPKRASEKPSKAGAKK
ncbi:YidC/Oxa1 family membrane protein insertase [Thermanaerothrix sp.]|jgi:YidC/Oxa1 family membrane protein insertase|uniref:YidC/Oxa1 family membrane protein insertase n=1 Tax=Thermanaerothrix sp. TaxID=2972675 RepID=UPI002ADDDF73|nr:YidC/Oxa1 family membrane protein insertase [Thermanaerothrix sp.]